MYARGILNQINCSLPAFTVVKLNIHYRHWGFNDFCRFAWYAFRRYYLCVIFRI